jgi:hypothetical protein
MSGDESSLTAASSSGGIIVELINKRCVSWKIVKLTGPTIFTLNLMPLFHHQSTYNFVLNSVIAGVSKTDV